MMYFFHFNFQLTVATLLNMDTKKNFEVIALHSMWAAFAKITNICLLLKSSDVGLGEEKERESTKKNSS